MYNLIDNQLENTIVLIDAMKRNWSVEIVFLQNNHHIRYKYVVPIYLDHERKIVQLQRFDERIFDISLTDIAYCEIMT
ncbi:hypothetical protein [Listeria seeligeri]|uniref:hypothetical protein n=1 Tax=Listeria seeligeri TaxID=1640 RepID=UPI001623F557|nr:hypothetical protein [Listeria seeligeri]MBC1722227.1 hypothetical protein [Listeria seeligeri]MBF2435754.1 hypothetical protein [Listeria seeligeri]